jgi:hypothetical protein
MSKIPASSTSQPLKISALGSQRTMMADWAAMATPDPVETLVRQVLLPSPDCHRPPKTPWDQLRKLSALTF